MDNFKQNLDRYLTKSDEHADDAAWERLWENILDSGLCVEDASLAWGLAMQIWPVFSKERDKACSKAFEDGKVEG